VSRQGVVAVEGVKGSKKAPSRPKITKTAPKKAISLTFWLKNRQKRSFLL
jgi:hypothetical protein